MFRSRKSRPVAFVALLASSLLVVPAWAAKVVDVRVGNHAKFTRIVFELDSSAGYRVKHGGTDQRPSLEITVDAATSAHALKGHGDVRGLKISAGPNARAEVALKRSGLRMKEMLLANPPRIVLDLMKPDAPALAASKPAPKAKPAPKPEPKPVQVTQKKPAPRPTPIKTTAKAPAPKPAPKPAEVAKTTPPALAPVPEKIADAAPKGLPSLPALPTAKPSKASDSANPTLAKAPEPPPAIKPAAPVRKVVPKPAPKPAATQTSKSKPATAKSPAPSESWMDRLMGSSTLWAAAGAGLAIVLAITGFAMWRRRRALPNDLDVAAIADEDEADAPDESAAYDEAPATMAEPEPTADSYSRDDTLATLFAKSSDPEPGDASGPSISPIAQPAASSSDADHSLFDDAPSDDLAGSTATQGDAPMNSDMDLPLGSDPSPAAPPMAAGPGPEVARLLEEMDQRVRNLEAKLEESNEAREKLERQVAAQSEELRVQRAAIARTQRALRTMSRSDEDKATEPALRGDTQAKTRVNV